MTRSSNPEARDIASPEISPAVYANKSYVHLMTDIEVGLSPHHNITYVPFTSEQQLKNPENLRYASSIDLPSIMSGVDIIICISRDEDPNPQYTDQYPERNIVLTPSGKSSIDKSVELFKLAQRSGNDEVKFIATGRMHNRAIRTMLALPVIAEAIGINAEDAYHISEVRFKELLDNMFTPHNIGALEFDSDNEHLAPNYKALRAIITDPKYGGANIPGPTSSIKEL